MQNGNISLRQTFLPGIGDGPAPVAGRRLYPSEGGSCIQSGP